MLKTIKAKYSNGVIEPLEKLNLEEGAELLVQIQEEKNSQDALKAWKDSFGGWVGLVDGEELKRTIYEARIAGSREPPAL